MRRYQQNVALGARPPRQPQLDSAILRCACEFRGDVSQLTLCHPVEVAAARRVHSCCNGVAVGLHCCVLLLGKLSHDCCSSDSLRCRRAAAQGCETDEKQCLRHTETICEQLDAEDRVGRQAASGM